MNWKTQINVNGGAADAPKVYDTAASDRLRATPELIDALNAAGAVFQSRSDNFAVGKAETCHDIAAKLRKYGSFRTDKQREFALKLIEWAKPRAKSATTYAPLPEFPKLHAVLQELADLQLPGGLKLSRKNQDTLVWVMFNDVCVGKLEDGGALTVFNKRIGDNIKLLLTAIRHAEENPLEAAKEFGRASGRCGVCGRDLTDPVSIAAGIGPVCAGRMS